MILYALIPVGVGEKAPSGVFDSRESAQAAAEVIYAKSDGYHDFQIYEMEVGTLYDTFTLQGYFSIHREPQRDLGQVDVVNPKLFQRVPQVAR